MRSVLFVFFLVSDQDQTLINLTGEGEIRLAGERSERLQLVAGDSVYLPAGIPGRVITHTLSLQVRFKAVPPGREVAVWYCSDCQAVVYWRSIDAATQIPQAAYWQAVQDFNTDAASRTCPECKAELPLAELGDIAAAIVKFHSENNGLPTAKDLAGFQVGAEPPTRTTFQDIDVYACGPWCQGPVLRQAPNLLEGYDLAAQGHNSPRYVHTVIEALQLAFPTVIITTATHDSLTCQSRDCC